MATSSWTRPSGTGATGRVAHCGAAGPTRTSLPRPLIWPPVWPLTSAAAKAPMPSGWPTRVGGSQHLTSHASPCSAAPPVPSRWGPTWPGGSPGCTPTSSNGSLLRHRSTWCRRSSCTCRPISVSRCTAAWPRRWHPGGTLLIVGHHFSDLQTTVPRPAAPDLFFTASDVAALLPPEEWVVVIDETRARITLDPDGAPTTIHDAVLRARRRG